MLTFHFINSTKCHSAKPFPKNLKDMYLYVRFLLHEPTELNARSYECLLSANRGSLGASYAMYVHEKDADLPD